MLKPVAAVGGALALAGAGAIGSISLMENFVIAGIKDVAACDENPVGQVGPFKSTLDFGCTVGSEVTLSSGATVSDTYATFAADKLESVPTSEFWPLFPVRNYFGLKPSLEKGLQGGLADLKNETGLTLTKEEVPAKFAELKEKVTNGSATPVEAALLKPLGKLNGLVTMLATEFESCQTAYETPVQFLGGKSFGVAVFDVAVEPLFDAKKENDPQVKGPREDFLQKIDTNGVSNLFQRDATQPGIGAFCLGKATELEQLLGLPSGTFTSKCTDVIDFVKPEEKIFGPIFAFVNNARTAANANAKSVLEAVQEWIVILGTSTAAAPAVEGLKKLLALKPVGDLCQGAAYKELQGLLEQNKTYADLTITPLECQDVFDAFVKEEVTKAVVGGITGVDDVTNLTAPDQVKQLVEKCEDQEKDLAAIEQAQILLPGGAAAAGLAALLLFVAVATAKAPLVLAGGFLGVVGGVVTLVALLGVKNAPVYANVGGKVPSGEVEYKQGLGATLGLVGIGAPVIGGLLGVGSFFCGSDEGGNELSSKVDNTY